MADLFYFLLLGSSRLAHIFTEVPQTQYNTTAKASLTISGAEG